MKANAFAEFQAPDFRPEATQITNRR